MILLQRRFVLALSTVFALIAATPAAADFAGGRQAEAEGDFKTAVKLYRQSADDGDARSLTNLGVLYAKGRGVSRNYGKAIALYREAAQQGQSTAQYNIGLAYRGGIGVKSNLTMATQWFRLAAKKRHVRAFYRLGRTHETGRGANVDLVESLKWYMLAAQHAKLKKGTSSRKLDSLATRRIETLVDQLREEKIQVAQQAAEAWIRAQQSGRT